MKIAIVGATGMVGNVILQVLAERNFEMTELIPVASEDLLENTFHLKIKTILLLAYKML